MLKEYPFKVDTPSDPGTDKVDCIDKYSIIVFHCVPLVLGKLIYRIIVQAMARVGIERFNYKKEHLAYIV